jgi:hypothetical protein
LVLFFQKKNLFLFLTLFCLIRPEALTPHQTMRGEAMNKSSELICAYSGLAFALFLSLGIGLVTGGIAPPDPALTASQVMQTFTQHTLNIRLGAALFAFGSMFFWPFCAAIGSQMKRIEGTYHPYADTQMLASNGTVIATLLVSFVWFAIAFRPESIPPGTAQALNDFCWIAFVAWYPPAVIQSVAIGLCILSGRNQGLYPRWLGFLNLWAALIFMPGALVPFFLSGPFAWNGLISYWLVAVVFFAWIVLMVFTTASAIKK